MYTIQLRNLPSKIYKKIKSSAEEEHRSLTQQAIYLIEKGISMELNELKRKNKKVEVLRNLKQISKSFKAKQITLEESIDWIREGRER